MILEQVIPEKCWCGTSEVTQYYDGKWEYIEHCILGKCNNCGTIRTIFSHTNKEYNYDNAGFYEIGPRQFKSIKTIIKHSISGKLLDIGCSSGGVINYIRKLRNDILVSGIDLNKLATENPVAPDLDIKNINLGQLTEKYNNIIGIHVLEHIPDLNNFFNQIRSISFSPAILYFAVPNIASYNAKKNISIWGALNPEQHSWHFSKNTLSDMILHFLPQSKIIKLKTSWIWPASIRRYYRNILFEGDQVEIVLKLNQ